VDGQFGQFLDSFGDIFSFKQACVPFLVEQQITWACDTSDSLSFEASNVLSGIVWVSNVSTEVWTEVGAFVWAFEGGGWCPWVSGDAFIRFGVQTLVAWFAEFQGEWEAGLS